MATRHRQLALGSTAGRPIVSTPAPPLPQWERSVVAVHLLFDGGLPMLAEPHSARFDVRRRSAGPIEWWLFSHFEERQLLAEC